jgi:hypothetical protein
MRRENHSHLLEDIYLGREILKDLLNIGKYAKYIEGRYISNGNLSLFTFY